MSSRFLKLARGHQLVNGRIHKAPTDADDAVRAKVPTVQRPATYRTIAISLYEKDVQILDREIEKQIAAGESPNRSLVIRRALRKL